MEFTLAWQDKKLNVLSELRAAIDCDLYTQYTIESDIMLLDIETMRASSKNEVATAIAHVIAGTLQSRAIENISRRALHQLTPEEQQTVNMLTMYRMSQKGMSVNNTGYIMEIAARVKDCLAAQPLHLEGFLCFRMRDVVCMWAKCMDEVVNKAIEEYEYQEYIKILKELLSCQPSVVECIYIAPSGDGCFKLMDSEGEMMLDGSSEFALRHGLSPEDELICNLLLKAPREIVIMDIKNSISEAAIDTIMHVFNGRVRMSGDIKIID